MAAEAITSRRSTPEGGAVGAAESRAVAEAPSKPRGPQRVAGADVVLVGGEPVLYLERSLKGLLVMVAHDDERLPAALRSLVDHAREHRKRLQLERIDGEPAPGHHLSALLVDAGLVIGPKRFTVGPAAPAAPARAGARG